MWQKENCKRFFVLFWVFYSKTQSQFDQTQKTWLERAYVSESSNRKIVCSTILVLENGNTDLQV